MKRALALPALLGLGVAAGVLATSMLAPAPEPALAWASSNRHRVLLRVDTRGIRRSSSVADVELDLAAEMAARGEPAAVDPDTIEVVA